MEAKYGDVMLTGPTLSEELGRCEIPLDLLIDEAPLVRGAAPSLRALGNQAHTITLTCIRRYASLIAAMEARAQFPRSLPLSGTLELTQTAGGVTIKHSGTALKAPCPTPVLMGRSVDFVFVFRCASLTTTYP